MHRIDTADAAAGNLFTEGNPATGVPATTLTDDWLNDYQENMAQFIESVGLALVKGDYTQLAKAIALASSRGAGLKNRVINGRFQIYTRGTTGSEGYVADRFRVLRVGNNVTNGQSRQSFTLGQTAVPNEPTYFHRVQSNQIAGAGNYTLFNHPIESVRTLAGQPAVLSFWAKADATKVITVEIVQDFGTGGSSSAQTTGIGVTKLTLSTSWQKFTIPVTLPSIFGKVLGTNKDDNVSINWWLSAGSNFDARTLTLGQQSGVFDFADVQFEPGSIATAIDQRSIAVERELCSRYCQPCIAANPLNVTGAGLYTVYGIYRNMRRLPAQTSGGGWTNMSTGGSPSFAAASTYYPASASTMYAGAESFSGWVGAGVSIDSSQTTGMQLVVVGGVLDADY